ncbi:hypothetical protein CPC16_000493 [Podila verticillata]|nr:hypothetical protein CPC16_000493 [Podila verticillata]
MLSIPSRNKSPLLIIALFLSFLTTSVLSSCCYSYTCQAIKSSDIHDPPPTSYVIGVTASSQPAVSSPNSAYHASITFPSNYIISAIPTGCISVSVNEVNCTSTSAAQLMVNFGTVIAAGVSNPVFESVVVNGETCTVSGSCPVPLLPSYTTTAAPSSVPSVAPPAKSPVVPLAPMMPSQLPNNGDNGTDMPLIPEPDQTNHLMQHILLGVTIPVLVLMAILGYCIWRRHRSQPSRAFGVLHDKDSTYSVGSDPFGEKGAMRYEAYHRSSTAYANEKDFSYGQISAYRPTDAGTGTRPPRYEEHPHLHGLGMTLVDIAPPSSISDATEGEANINYFQGEDDSVERSSLSSSDVDSFVHFDHRSMDLTLAGLSRPAAALTTSGGAEVSVDGGMTGAQDGNTNMQRSKSIRYPFNANTTNNGPSSVTVTANLQRSASCASSIDSTKSQRLRNQLRNNSFQGPLHLQSEAVQELQKGQFRSSARQSAQQKVPLQYGSQTSLRPMQVPATITRSVSMGNRPLNNNKRGSMLLTSEPLQVRPPRSVHRKPSRETVSGLSRTSSVASSHSLALVEEEIIRSFSSSSSRTRRAPPAPLALVSSARSLVRPGHDDPVAAVVELGEEEVVVRPRQPKNSNNSSEEDLTGVYRRSGGIYGYV